MSALLAEIAALLHRGEILVSRHGFRELAADDIVLAEVLSGLTAASPVEEYPAYGKGPCVLVLQRDHSDRPIHVLWGMPKGRPGPAVLITAYRPDPNRWSEDFKRRVKS